MIGPGMVYLRPEAGAAAGSDHLGSLLDGFGTLDDGGTSPYAATGAVNDGAGFAQYAGNAAAGTARGSGNDSDFVL